MFDINNLINTAIATAVQQAVADALAPIYQRLNALEAFIPRIEQLERHRAAMVTRIGALEDRTQVVLSGTPVDVSISAFVQGLDIRVSRLEKAAPVTGGDATARLTEIENRLNAVRTITEEKFAALEVECDELGERIQQVDDQIPTEDYLRNDVIRPMIQHELQQIDLEEAIDGALNEFDFSGKLEDAIDSYDFDDKVADALNNIDLTEYFDLDDAVRSALNEFDWTGKVREELDGVRVTINL